MVKSFLTIICVLFIVSTCMINAFAAPSKEYLSSREFLSKVCNEANKTMPMMIDKETMATSTYALDKELNYAYTLVHYSSADIDKQEFLSKQTPSIKNFVCKSPDMQKFQKNGVSISYVYYGNDKGFIAKITVTPSQCGF